MPSAGSTRCAPTDSSRSTSGSTVTAATGPITSTPSNGTGTQAEEATMTERDGRLTVEGDRAVLTFERRLPYPDRSGVVGHHRPAANGRSGSARRRSTPARAARSTWSPPARRFPRAEADDRPHPGLGSAACARARVEAADRRGRRRALRTAARRRRHPASLQPSRPRRPQRDRIPRAAPTRTWTAWRPISPATSCPTGRSARARKSIKHGLESK